MPTPRTRPSPAARRHPVVPEKQIHRWLDDGGAYLAEPADDHRPATPVMWTPVALNARLDAERALHALCRRPRGASADARTAISRVVRQVERRQISLRTAAAQLRNLTVRLEQHVSTDKLRHAPREWQLLRTRTPANERLDHRFLATAAAVDDAHRPQASRSDGRAEDVRTGV